MNTTAAIAVSGLGVVGAAGVGKDALALSLADARPCYSDVDRSAGFHVEGSARRAGLVGKIDVGRWIPPLVARRMSPPSRFAVVAARTALDDAGLEPPSGAADSTAVVVSTAFGATSYTQRLLDRMLDEGPDAASAAVFTECVANAPAAQVAIHARASGPNFTVCARESGDLAAVARAATEIAGGRARRALVGSVDQVVPVLHATLDRFGALARDGAGGPEAPRPFDRNRNGFTAAEGASVIVLEHRDEIARRDGAARVWVRGWQQAFDATAPRADWGRGDDRLGDALARCLDRCGVAPDEVDVVVSGASGSVAGDRLEALTLRRVWKDRPLPPVIAPKSVTGEYGGGFLAAAVLLAGGLQAGPTAGFESPDPDLGLVPHDGSPLPDVRLVLVSALAAGGAGTWLLLESDTR